MKITELNVEKFRNISGLKIVFGERLNAIAGQNGTSKTSILGLIGHIFTFDKDHKTLAGKTFTTDFSEIFRFAYPEYDKAGDHIWVTKLDVGEVSATSHDRIQSGTKKTIRVRVGGSKRGSGKRKLPVIYLGMGRLFPLTLEENIKSNISDLSAEEVQEFSNLHNEILMMVDEQITPESITSSSKSFYAPTTATYNHLGNSAGQDNLGQIITALMSFRRLRHELGDRYIGGILLIDELDASLFPAAQMKLVEKLDRKAQELDLQVFFTTHSLEVLSETARREKSQVIVLDKSSGSIKPKYNLEIDELRKDLLVLGPDALKMIQRKRYVYCEDTEAADMIKSILTKDIKDKLEIFPTKLGESVLKEIARRSIPDFKNSILVLDGDTITSGIKNVLSLPGRYGPDRIIYEFLKNLDSANFEKIKKGYTKQFCFRDANNLSVSAGDLRVRQKVKDWYKSQKSYWGNNGGRVWKMWAEDNNSEIEDFISDLTKLI